MAKQNRTFKGHEPMEYNHPKVIIMREGITLECLPSNDNKTPRKEILKRLFIGSLVIGILSCLFYFM